jgi:hypothetical protein
LKVGPRRAFPPPQALLAAPIAVLRDYERGQKRKMEDLHKAKLLEAERIILAKEIACRRRPLRTCGT